MVIRTHRTTEQGHVVWGHGGVTFRRKDRVGMSWQVSDSIGGCSLGVLCVRDHTAVVRGKETGDSGSWPLFLKVGCRVHGSRDGSGIVFQGIEIWSFF